MSRLLSAVLVACVALSGCGGGGASSNKEKRAEKGNQEKKDTRLCDVRGINVQGGNTGTCIREKQWFTLVNRHSTLGLKELSVRLGKLSTKSEVPEPVGSVKAPTGRVFVVVNLTWRNRD